MSGRFWVGVIGLWMWLAAATGRAAAAPREAAALDKPAFTAAPGELLGAATLAPAGDWPVVLLRDELDIRYDDQGRATVRWRWVFVVRTQAGIDDWGTLHAGWRPFHQDRPVLRARVIAPTGQVAELDPSLVTDAAVAGSANVLSDRRRLDAPLPRLQIGAIVEEEVVTRDREPILPVGNFAIGALGNDVPTATTLFTFSLPASRKGRPVERKLPAGLRARHEVRGGRETWSYGFGALPVLPSVESGVPGEIVLAPYIGLSAAPSWAAVARAYHAVVERRIADGPLSLPAELPRSATLETIEAITRWLHRQVRYTGIELGDASIVPWSPAEVVKRGFGDCKDKATLLVALLRQAGLRADLALLSTGPGRDIDPELPGIGSFDHAIVRVRLAGREVWIDATDELARPGQLPVADQGRRSLVIADDTAGLAITPSARSADNVVREIRTYLAAEDGVARVTEVSRATGVFESQRRAEYRDTRADELQKTYRDYVESRYAGKLDRISASDPLDLGAPFELRVDASDVRRLFTSSEQIDVYLYPRSTFHELPWEVVSTDKQAETRTQEFAWQRPHIYEVEHRIEIPPGYTLPAATPERTRPLGASVTFTESRRVDGRTLIVTFRLDTGKPRLTAAELLAVRTGIAELSREEVHLQIPHTAFALSHEGKLREAIAECRRLIALHPGEPLHHGQLATVLLRAGAGQAARRAARAAVAMAPGDADALATLGWVLTFDTLGRAYTYDWDRAGAIAALQKARKLSPGHVGAALTLADVLQHDASGHNLDLDADLRGAADAWRAALELDATDDHRIALTRVLLRSGRFAEAEAAARAAEAGDDRDKLLVAAVAAGRGVPAAVQTARDLRTGAASNTLLDSAGRVLMVEQRYELGRSLLVEAGTQPLQSAEQRAKFDRVTARPPVPAGSADPEAAVRDVLLTTMDGRRRTPVFWDDAFERAFRDGATVRLPAAMADGFATRFFADIILSTAAITLDRGAGVWRADVDSGDKAFQLYLALDRGQVKLVGTSDIVDGIGRYVLRARDAASQARARQLLDWVRADLARAAGTRTNVLAELWGSGVPTSPDAVALAGAVLAGQSSALSGRDAAPLIGPVARCPAARPGAAEVCRKVLARAHAASGQWQLAAAQLDGVPEVPADRDGLWRANVLSRAGRCDDADRLASRILDQTATHHDGLVARFLVGTICARPDVAQRGDALIGDPQVTAMDLNNVAWFRMVSGGNLEAARELARRATAVGDPSRSAVNTLAAIEAESGQLAAAVQSNLRALELGHGPGPGDWYVIGRIHDQLGLIDDARAAYQRVPLAHDAPLGSYTLAQKRLAALSQP